MTSLAQTSENEPSSSGSGPSIGTRRKSSSGWRGLGAAHGGRRHLRADDLGPRAGKERGELAGPAAEVQYAISIAHVREQKRPPQLEVRRL